MEPSRRLRTKAISSHPAVDADTDAWSALLPPPPPSMGATTSTTERGLPPVSTLRQKTAAAATAAATASAPSAIEAWPARTAVTARLGEIMAPVFRRGGGGERERRGEKKSELSLV